MKRVALSGGTLTRNVPLVPAPTVYTILKHPNIQTLFNVQISRNKYLNQPHTLKSNSQVNILICLFDLSYSVWEYRRIWMRRWYLQRCLYPSMSIKLSEFERPAKSLVITIKLPQELLYFISAHKTSPSRKRTTD